MIGREAPGPASHRPDTVPHDRPAEDANVRVSGVILCIRWSQ